MKRIFILLVAIFMVVTAFGQDSSAASKNSFMGNVFFEIATGAGVQHDKKSFFQSVNLGYCIADRLSLFAHIEDHYRLRDDNGLKTYRNSGVLGGGVGLTILRETHGWAKCDLRFIMGHSTGHCDLTHTLYDVGLSLKIGKFLFSNVGAGFRHLNVQTAGVSNMNYPYLSFGISL